jgi:hypothetical protein
MKPTGPLRNHPTCAFNFSNAASGSLSLLFGGSFIFGEPVARDLIGNL